MNDNTRSADRQVDDAPPGPTPAPELLVAGVSVTPLPRHVRDVIVEERLGVVGAADSIRRLALLAALIIGPAALALITRHPAAWVLYWLLAPQVVASAFAAEHEALHGSLFDSIRLNHAVGIALGVLCACPYAAYRAFHLRHHARTHVEGDSEAAMVLTSRAHYLVVVPNIVTGLAVLLHVQLAATLLGRGPTWAPLRRGRGVYLATLAAHVVTVAGLVAIGVTFGWPILVALVFVPLVCGLVIAGFLAAPEHYECPYGPAPVETITRSTISNRITRFFMWNANFHTAHHLVPAVPGRSLPRLYEHLSDLELIEERSYWHYHSGLWRRIGRGELPGAPPWEHPAASRGSVSASNRNRSTTA